MRRERNIFTKPRSTETLKFIMFDEGTVDPIHAVKAYKGEGCKASFILHVGTKWRGVVNLTHWLLYPQRKITRNTLKRRLGRANSLSGCCGEGKKSLAPISN
jgi:hypothetical protein